MFEIAKIVAAVMLLALGALVALMFWALCKAAQEEFRDDPHPPLRGTSPQGKASEDPCERCLRWSECEGVDKDCPLRR